MLETEFYNIEAEAAILGTIILNNEYLRMVEDILKTQHFYDIAHQKIYEKISTGSNDKITLKNFFDSEFYIKQLGGSVYLSSLLAAASTVIDIRNYAFIVLENYNKRQSQELLSEGLIKLKEENCISVIDDITNKLSALDSESSQVVIKSGKDMYDKLLINWQNKESMQPISSGIKSLDKMLNGGFCKKKLYIIGASPGSGKTSFAQQVILQALKEKIGCFFFSIEMEEENVLTRFLGFLSQINPFRILIKNIFKHEEEIFENCSREFIKLQSNFLMSDDTNISTQKIKAVLKRAKRKIPISLVVVDYIQIMQLSESKNNLSEATLIKENITALKDIAKTFDVSVIALSQITKDSLGAKPTLKALKGSGGIGEGADTVINLWIDENEENQSNNSKVNFSIVKNRNGPKGDLVINFDGEFGIFTETTNKF